MTVAQLFLFLFGCTAIALVNLKDPWRKYGCLFGLAGQPFWFYETWVTQQWGMFAVTVIYTVSWAFGIYNNWIKNDK